MSNKTINFFLAILLLALGFMIYAYNSAAGDAEAQIAANGTGELTDPTADKVARFANHNETMRQAVLNVHAARGVNHEGADGFGAKARDNGGASLAMVQESEVPAIMKEYRRLRAEKLARPAEPKREDRDEEEEVEDESSNSESDFAGQS